MNLIDHMHDYIKQATVMPKYYACWDERQYKTHGAVYGQHRDSEIADQSNYQQFIDALEEIDPDGDGWFEATASHFLVGWTETIFVDITREDLWLVVTEMLLALEEYPLLNEEDFSNREYEEAVEIFDNDAESIAAQVAEEILDDFIGDLEWHRENPEHPDALEVPDTMFKTINDLDCDHFWLEIDDLDDRHVHVPSNPDDMWSFLEDEYKEEIRDYVRCQLDSICRHHTGVSASHFTDTAEG